MVLKETMKAWHAEEEDWLRRNCYQELQRSGGGMASRFRPRSEKGGLTKKEKMPGRKS